MPNPNRGEAVVTLEGKQYDLVIDNNAICEIEKNLEMPITEWARGGYRLVRELVFVGLVPFGNERRPTREKVGDMIGASDITHVTEVAALALKLAQPQNESEDAPRPLPAVVREEPKPAAG